MIYSWISTLSLLGTAAGAGWQFVQNGTSGLVGLETVFVSPTLALMFDKATNDPIMINNHTTWGALWNIQTNKASPLAVISDSFCASGGFLSNGTLVSVGGNRPNSHATDGRMGIRLFEPCNNPSGAGCTLFEDQATLHLVEMRWYPSSLRLFDGSLMVLGGVTHATPFYNTNPVNSYEFFPPKDGGVPRPSAFLQQTVPANLFPRGIALPDGTVFIAANNRSIIYNVETNTETPLPSIPNGVRVTNPFDGTATLLPLSPPNYTPEVLICGGSTANDATPSRNLTSQDVASRQCSRITLTPAGIKKGWEVEQMLEPRIMPEFVLLPNGQVLIINGAKTGYAAIDSVGSAIDHASNADHPVLTPSIYTPSAPLGQRISNAGMPTSNIPRMYHSTATLTPKGNILIAGSNPNNQIVNTTRYPSEFRVEYLNPPFMTVARPKILTMPKKIAFNSVFTVGVSIPANLSTTSIQVALIDLGFSTHAFQASARLVFMVAHLSTNRASLTITSPPNNRVYPPGPAYVFLTVNGVSSEGVQVMVGSGAPPPVPNQGIAIKGKI